MQGLTVGSLWQGHVLRLRRRPLQAGLHCHQGGQGARRQVRLEPLRPRVLPAPLLLGLVVFLAAGAAAVVRVRAGAPGEAAVLAVLAVGGVALRLAGARLPLVREGVLLHISLRNRLLKIAATDTHVVFIAHLRREASVANGAFERPFLGVRADVDLQSGVAGKHLKAYVTGGVSASCKVEQKGKV